MRLEAPLTTPLTYIGLFGLGAIVMRGAGCTINDLWDKNLDKAVAKALRENTDQTARARGYNAPSGIGVPRRPADCWTRRPTAVKLVQVPILLGASSLSIVVIYPLMKRITYWPQAVLGLAFNWGALLGWSAVAGTVNWGVSSTPTKIKADDVNVGIRSTALLFGERSRPILSALSFSTVSLITYAGFLNVQGAPFYLGVGLGAAQLARVLWRTDFDSGTSCWQGFVGCGWSGFWVWMGALADYGIMISGVV
ncbi:4-hydroxybenzoate polyprenyl transferase [Melanogaster broomeanus]|nr:4-hydroxybenzoate polyprenyl transferase [Melanogaster broomeanus]